MSGWLEATLMVSPVMAIFADILTRFLTKRDPVYACTAATTVAAGALIGLVVIGLGLTVVAAAADASENFQVVAGVVIYLHVIAARIVQRHPKTASGSDDAWRRSSRERRDHVVVALFDKATDQCIENAQ